MARQKLFKNMKLQEKYSLFLKEKYNATEVDSRTGKYIVLKTVDFKGDLYWFLGKSGALRINRRNCSTHSLDNQPHMQLEFNSWCLDKGTIDED